MFLQGITYNAMLRARAFCYNEVMTTVHRIYQERAYLRRSGHRRLDEAFRECARLYNAALEHWRDAWKQRDSVTLYEQFRELTAIRAKDEFWGSVSVGIGRGVLRRLERARQAFYHRCGSGQAPGYPRFRAARRCRTIEVAGPTPGMTTNNRQGKRYECGACGLAMDADTNAAVNILTRGLATTGVGTPPGLAA